MQRTGGMEEIFIQKTFSLSGLSNSFIHTAWMCQLLFFVFGHIRDEDTESARDVCFY